MDIPQLRNCKKCDSPLTPDRFLGDPAGGYCTDLTCPYSDHKQDETYTED